MPVVVRPPAFLCASSGQKTQLLAFTPGIEERTIVPIVVEKDRMSSTYTHVIASMSGGWSIYRTAAKRAEKTFKEKSEAVKYARKVARARSMDLVIHASDGRVIERNHYGSKALSPPAPSKQPVRKK